jgi:hypothetical protein
VINRYFARLRLTGFSIIQLTFIEFKGVCSTTIPAADKLRFHFTCGINKILIFQVLS